MNITIKDYPYNSDYVFTISIDDLHPETRHALEQLDFGSSPNMYPLRALTQIIQEFPQIKFTLFSVPQWIDRADFPNSLFFPLRKIWRKRRNYPEDEFNLADKKYTDWSRKINAFYPKNIEIAQHGLFHHTSNVLFARSQEFANLSVKEIASRLSLAENIFQKSKLKHSGGFRPPGWYINENMLKILENKKFLYIAGSSDMFSNIISRDMLAKGAGLPKQKLLLPTKNSILYNFTANCYPNQVQRAVEIVKNRGILMVHCHITQTEFGLIAVSKKFPHQIKKIISEITYQTGFEPWFATLKELAEFMYAKEKVSYKVMGNTLYITNNSKFDLRGLTVEVNNVSTVIKNISSHKTQGFTILKKRKSKKVSLILTVYNGEKTIEASLDSLAHQTCENTEIIIVNDGSTDNSERIIERYIRKTHDNRIKVITQKNKGRAAAKNVGLWAAKGDIIGFCEDDAIYSKNYIFYAVKRFTDENILGVIGPHYVWNKNQSITTKAKDLERRRNFTGYNPSSAWIYKREDLLGIGGFNENLEAGEDIEPGIKLARKYPHKFFVFEPKSIWLHQEPANFVAYLKRKYKGGVGMALLDRLNIKKFPKRVILLFLVLPVAVVSLTLSLFFIQYDRIFLIPIILLAIFAMLLFRKNDIKKSLILSKESIFTIMVFILVEYIWWVATLTGIYIGFLLPYAKAKRLLAGR